YMSAVVAMTGRGGWPMSVMLTPELKPFWGGTYLPKDHLLQLCAKVKEVWAGDPKQILQTGDQLSGALSQMDRGGEPIAGVPDQEIFRRFLGQANEVFDPEEGGFSAAPKFPSASAIRTLLRLSRFPSTFDQAHSALEMAEKSLEGMACGGIFDQLGGGFHRYSVDARWLVPHFEKMLTDNALLAVAYLEAYQLTGREIFSGVARETLDYLLRDMRAPGGAFFAAEDAGPVGKEGEFYVWNYAELEDLPQFADFFRHFAVIKEGNFEHGTNVLCLGEAEDWEPSRDGNALRAREELLRRRSKRPRPHRDEKILTGWNGLTLAALSLGAATLNEARFLKAAEESAAWMKKNLWNGKTLYRRYAGGEAKYQGTASDYAFLIDGLIQLYQAGFNEDHLLWARELQAALDKDFWDEAGGGYFTASRTEENLIVRKKDRHDGAIPSPNSVSYRNLLALAQYFVEPALGERANKLLEFMKPVLEGMPFGAPEAGVGFYFHHRGENLLVLSQVSDEAVESVRGFLPEVLLARTGAEESRIPALRGKSKPA
ncbi:MAG: thioredoxin domain-containing protein, partial [Proteobacteria bacterium]